MPRGRVPAALALVASAATAAMGAALRLRPTTGTGTGMLLPVGPHAANIAARRLNRAAGTLAASVLFDSAVEHYRGQFENKAMFTPIVTSALALCVSIHGTADQRERAHALRDAIYLATAIVGVVGTAFHVYNVRRKPGRFSAQNMFYGAPLGAPMAIGLSGALGYLSERIRATPGGRMPLVWGMPAGRVVGVVTGVGIAGTVVEAGFLHFRGSFHDPFMYLPVAMPPVAALAIMHAALADAARPRPATRWWLRATAILGFAGTGFHAIGVGRDMDGWRNWQQNILNGPPLPAPPAFTGLALAGLAALDLLKDGDHV